MIDRIAVRPMKPAMLPEINRLFNAIFSDYLFRSMKLEIVMTFATEPGSYASTAA